MDGKLRIDDRNVLNKLKTHLMNSMNQFKKRISKERMELALNLIRDAVLISAKKQLILNELAEAIREKMGMDHVDKSVDIYMTNARHAQVLRDANVSLSHVQKSINGGLPEDFYTQDLVDAYASLGSIIGESVEDDLVEKVFSDFCMGK